MNYRVYKYAAEPGVFEIELPEGAEVLYFHSDPQQVPSLWVRLDVEAPQVKCRRFAVVGTGHPAPPPDQGKYIGSCMGQGGVFIWHLFECITDGAWGFFHGPGWHSADPERDKRF